MSPLALGLLKFVVVAGGLWFLAALLGCWLLLRNPKRESNA